MQKSYIISNQRGGVMINTEFECSILDYDIELFKEKLKSLGLKLVSEDSQKRYVYDFQPVNPNSWIRLRTNGKETTLAVKDIKDKNAIGGTSKLEVTVESFAITNEILNRMGFRPRNYQENKREEYIYKDVKVKIDYWPQIPPYIKIEGKNESEVLKAIEELGLSNEQITTLDVESIYKQVYGIDLLNIRELRF